MRVDWFQLNLKTERDIMRLGSLSFAAALVVSTTLFLGGCKSSAPASAAAPASSPDASAPSAAPPSSAAPAPAPSASGAAPAAPAVAPAPGAPAVAPAPAPVAAAPAPPPPPPPPVKVTAPAGTAVVVTVTQELRASKNNVGDGFTGVLAQSVKAPDGAVIFPRGAHVVGTVVASKGQGKFKGSGALGIQVTSISGMPVSVSEYEKEQSGKGKRSAAMIGGGAGGGALIGGIAGGGKGALIGGLIGAGAGTAGAAFTGNKDVVIPSESTINFHLTAPITVTVKPKETTEQTPLPSPQ
jgi:hypothetical protein